MSSFLPLDSLSRPAPGGFGLAMANPVVGKALFLRLPDEGEWTYQVDPASLRAQRHLLLRDEMWVTRGEARVTATHRDGARFELHISVQPWKPRGQPCQRRGSAGGRLSRLAARLGRKPSFILRCCRTERQITIAWRAASVEATSRLLQWLAALRCHETR